ncbi:MAG: tetratricopeptide repeat protein [bacterium]|nr:tetratricopeptide repeat protein [bacterium]
MRQGQVELKIWLGVVGLSAFVVYLNALGNGLVYDDHFLIERSWLVRQQEFWRIFTTHYWAGYPGNETGHYRPLTVLSLVLDGWGGVAPFRYHLTNVVLHILNSLLAFEVCRRIGLETVAAGIAGVLFAVHPVHAEVVAGVTFGRSDLLAALFLFGALIFYIHSQRSGRWISYGLSLGIFFLGLLSKESALTLGGLVVFYDLAFGLRDGVGWRGVVQVFLRSIPRWVGFGVVFGVCLAVRYLAAGLGFSPGSMSVLVNPLLDASLWVRLLTAAKLFWYYSAMLVVPVRLSVDYSYNAIPVASSVLEPEVLGGLLLGIVALGGWFWAFSRRRRIFFSGAMFLVPYAAVSQAILLLNAMFQERFLYVPSLGIFALGGMGVAWLYRRQKVVVIVCVAAGLLAYAGRTVARNQDWKDDLSLFRSAVEAYPNSAKMHHAMGDVLAERGYLEQAIVEFRAALAIREEAMTYNNLGNAYGVQGAYKQAMDAYRSAVGLQPSFTEAWINMGVTALRSGQMVVAGEAFERAAELRPEDSEIWFNMGVAWENAGQMEDAASAYDQAVYLDRGLAKAYFNLGKVYRALGQTEQALRAFRQFLDLWRGDVQVADLARMHMEEIEH